MAAHDTIGERIDSLACSKCGTVMDVSASAPFSMVQCPRCNLRMSIPKRLGDFLLLRFLGKGGMGAVFVGYDPKLGRQVAIKVLGDILGDDVSAVDNFLREARAAAQINSPNVVQIYQVGEQNNQPFIVMELISGGQLDKMIEKAPLDEIRALEVCRDAANGLAAAQSIGFFHGDIKPENILFDQHHVAKIADFGLAQFLQRGKKSKPGEIWGTPYYIAPEKARRQQEDYRSDIYSLGATLFHVMAGQPPFDGETAADVVIARLKNPPPDIRAIRPGIHAPTAELILRMLEPDPNRRYPNYTSLLSDIDDVIRKVKAEKVAEAHAAENRRKRKIRLVVLTVVLLVLLSVAALFVTREDHAELPDKQDSDIALEINAWMNNTYRYDPAAVHTISEKMKTIAAKLPPGHRGKDWITLLRGALFALSRDSAQMSNTLAQLAQKDAPTELDGDPNPACLPVRLAAFMLGPDAQPPPPPFPSPSWFSDFSAFLAAVKALGQADFATAQKYFDAYHHASKKPEDQLWPYVFKPIALPMSDEIKRWQNRNELIDRDIKRGNYDKARERLAGYEPGTAPVFMPFVEMNRARISESPPPTNVAPGEEAAPAQLTEQEQRQAEEDERMRLAREEEARIKEEEKAARKRAREEKERLEEEERQRILAADLDTFSRIRDTTLEFIRLRQFSRALQEASPQPSPLTTDTGHGKLARLADLCRALVALDREIYNQMGRVPLPVGLHKALGGIPKNADSQGIVVTLTHGEILRPWDTITMPQYVQIAEMLMAGSRLDANEKAQHLLALTLFLRILPAPETRILTEEQRVRELSPSVYQTLDAYREILP